MAVAPIAPMSLVSVVTIRTATIAIAFFAAVVSLAVAMQSITVAVTESRLM